eukprot:TRINITY_DN2551_c0_g1_i1.p1 TRINITY_DN2551_c0_g1~~TRINITY_DN2551_c0_g1_i1.p1  ORF type:complete len:285 (-),score=2.21 TRINITY_DN2551_c0_g1_i1:141-995(-)
MESEHFPVVSWSDLRAAEPSALRLALGAFREHSLLIVRMQPECDTIRHAFHRADEFFTHFDKEATRVSSKFGYKRSTSKERFQFRQSASDLAVNASTDFKQAMRAVFTLFETVAACCVDLMLDSLQLPADQRRAFYTQFCDPPQLPPGKFGTSVFNVFHYFNSEEARDAENCAAHVDPGLITVLAKASAPGLEVFEPCLSRYCINVEQFLGDHDVLVLNGESLHRLSDGQFRGCLHKVGKSTVPRINLTYELRPRVPVYYPWPTLLDRAASGQLTEQGMISEAC